jgi:hypothetical protein
MRLLFLLIILPFTLNAQIFKPEDHYPLKNGRPIYEEIIEIPNKELVDSLCKFVFNEKYNFLFVNCDTQRFFKNFDEIIINE